jgi:hypothetical protein
MRPAYREGRHRNADARALAPVPIRMITIDSD